MTRQFYKTSMRWILLVLVYVAITTGCAGVNTQSKPADVPEIHPGLLEGYLQPGERPNCLALIPPPPAQGSVALALDEEMSRKSLALLGTPRGELANKDAEYKFPEVAGTFSCALGAPITEKDTPHLYMLLRRTLADAGLSTYTAKNHYQRKRPFMNNTPICTTDDKEVLMKDGSYPSGHTAFGWAWALILTEIAPERADAILARGRAFGESRNVCNVHWHSDVVWGRFMGAATVARLHANPAFCAELAAAKAELAAVRAKGLKPTRDCEAEAAALALGFQASSANKVSRNYQADAKVGQLEDGKTLLPNNQVITPAGEQIAIKGRANAIAISKDGKTAAILDATGDTIVIIDLESKKVKQEFGVSLTSISNSPVESSRTASGSFHGIVFTKDDSTLFASQADGKIIMAKRSADGKFIPSAIELPKSPIIKSGTKENPYPGGLALSDDEKFLYVCLNRNNTLGVIDIENKKLIDEIPVGNAPVDVVVVGKKAYVTNRGGRLAKEGDVTADSSGTAIVVHPESGYTISGTVSVVDLKQRQEVASIEVGLHPTKIIYDDNRLFVANSNSDTVSIIDVSTQKVIKSINTAPFEGAMLGSSPTSLALMDEDHLLVTLGQNNAVAVYELPEKIFDRVEFLGLIPTAWYPGDIAVDSKNKKIIVANTKGIGSQGPEVIGGPGMTTEGAEPTKTKGKWVYAHTGTVSIVPFPSQKQLFDYTKVVLENGNFRDLEKKNQVAGQSKAKPVPVPKKIGDPSVFKHVFFIIKENKTYDQVLGDMKQGNGDPNLVQFGRKYTPNHHALAKQFILLDNFYVAGTASLDGHQWMTQAFCVDYIEKAFGHFARSHPFAGFDPLAYPKTGFIWEHAVKAGKSVRVYGEYADLYSDKHGHMGPWASELAASGGDSWGGGWSAFYNDYLILRGKKEGQLHTKLESRSDIPSLERLLDKDYPAFNFAVPDVYRAEMFIRDFNKNVNSGSVPNFNMIMLPNDHTLAYFPGFPTPYSMVADNDLALGRIIETISKSPIWKESVIFVTEDDTQDGVDHVDGHRTLCFVASPYTKRGAVDSNYYTNLDLTRAMLQILGVPPINQLVMAIDPRFMAGIFTDEPDFTPYQALPSNIPLDTMNPMPENLSGIQKEWSLAMKTLDWEVVDGADWPMLNRVVWYVTKGFDTPYPGDSRVLYPDEVHAYLKASGKLL